jgi:hypothetical protein
MTRMNSDVRWTWIFATVGLLVVLVVVGFLLGIVNALENIDDGLKEADTAVTGAGGGTKPLPAHIADINGNLAAINTSLKPITGEAGSILNALTSINGSLGSANGSLGSTDGSLKSTSGSLVGTSSNLRGISSSLVDTSGVLKGVSSSLADTSGVLVNVGSLVAAINRQLIAAESVKSLGTAEIPLRVARANAVLGPVENDTSSAVTGLSSVNAHLTSICKSRLLTLGLPTTLLVTTSGPC